MNFKITKALIRLGVLFIYSSVATPFSFAQNNVVLQWDQAALQAVRSTRMGPPMVARALAIVHTSMYDAWAAYDTVAVGTRLGATLRRPNEEHASANKEKAVSYAAYRALVDLFPASQHEIFTSLMGRLGYDPNDNSTDAATPAGIGSLAAGAVIAFRRHDGANQLGDLHPGAYSDYTNYRPVNGPDFVKDPNRWQPLRLPNGQVQQYLAPHWGRVAPFAMLSPSEFGPEKAPAFYHHQAFGWPYLRQALEILHVSANLGDREKMISEYWSDGPATETPPGHWCLLAQFVSRRDGNSLDEDVKMFFALTNGLLDSSIAVWEWKRRYDYVRPVTAIRNLFKGRRVRAWAGPFRGTQPVFGEDWQPYQIASFITPPFAEYVSGHSAFSAASAEILKSFTGSDHFGASVTLPAGSSRIETGLTPVNDLILNWETFSEAAEEASLSRLYGGIHFTDGNAQGRIMGRKIGAVVWNKAQAYFQGRVSVD